MVKSNLRNNYNSWLLYELLGRGTLGPLVPVATKCIFKQSHECRCSCHRTPLSLKREASWTWSFGGSCLLGQRAPALEEGGQQEGWGTGPAQLQLPPHRCWACSVPALRKLWGCQSGMRLCRAGSGAVCHHYSPWFPKPSLTGAFCPGGEDTIQEDTFPSHQQAWPALPILAQGAGIHARGNSESSVSPTLGGSCSGCGTCVGWAGDGWGVLCQGTTSKRGENQLGPTEFCAV